MQTSFLTCFLAAVTGGVLLADDYPAWIKEAMARPTPASAKTAAVALHDVSTITVSEGGKMLTQAARAVRILRREGASEAVARVVYVTDTGKVKEFRAWLIRPSGQVSKYSKNETLDVALVNNDVYNEVRSKVISARGEADPGSVFAWEFELEDKSVFTQFEKTFQEDIPVLLARFSVALPPGWDVAARTYNHPSLQAAVTDGRHAWELRDMGALPREILGPTIRSLAPRVAVSANPPSGLKTAGVRSFKAWADVAKWLHEIAEPQMIANNALLEKAQSITRNAKTDWEKIEQIGRYVQSVQYVSIQTGLGRGGGYQPRPATLVLERNYGGCKDKANLMRAMLKSVGVESYPVVIYSGDRTYVHEDWPSPQQFNHCILGARLKDETAAPAVATHPKLGPMIFFDPTDDQTDFGSLPSHEEGSLALVVAPQSEGLTRMPSSRPHDNLTERSITGTLEANGTMTSVFREVSKGHAAAASRRRGGDASGGRKYLEGMLAGYTSGAKIADLQTKSSPGEFEYSAQLSVNGFAQPMAGNFLMVRPGLVGIVPALPLGERTRTQPLLLEARKFADSISIELPEGYVPDELPDPVKMQEAFATFEATYQVNERKMELKRSMTIHGGIVPPEQYGAVREFFGRAGGSGRMPVVLTRKH